jgi:hypothetical protein
MAALNIRSAVPRGDSEKLALGLVFFDEAGVRVAACFRVMHVSVTGYDLRGTDLINPR